MTLSKPSKTIVPIKTGLAWDVSPDHLCFEKLDGEFCTQRIASSLIAGELLCGKHFVAFDLLAFAGRDFREYPLRERWSTLKAFANNIGLNLVGSSPNGGELLRAVLGRNGEGIVRKRLDSVYDDAMEACKRLGVWQCVVTNTGARQSVEIADATTGQPRGNVALFGGKCERVRVGSILKIEGMELTSAGKIREPRPCKDSPESWLVKY